MNKRYSNIKIFLSLMAGLILVAMAKKNLIKRRGIDSD